MPRFDPDEIVISPVTEEDLPSIAAGFYQSFGEEFHSLVEPLETRPSQEVREKRFAERMKPWITDPNIKCSKATLASDIGKPPRVIGHTAWLIPQPEGVHGFHYWRSDSYKERGYQRKFGTTDEQLKDWWEHANLSAWDGLFTKYDIARKDIMKGEPHWFLAPIWVLPEYQGRGVGSLLIKEVSDIADAQDPPIPMFLETAPEAMTFYPKVGFEFVEFPPDDEHDKPYTAVQMIRRGPKQKTKKLVD